MKAICTKVKGRAAMFHILDGHSMPVPDQEYYIEDYMSPSEKQRKAREALITEYWVSGKHPTHGGDQKDKFRKHLKRSLGQGVQEFHYGYFIGEELTEGTCKSWDLIPEECRELWDKKKSFIVGRLKSFSDYSKSQTIKFIDRLIDDMTASGVNSEKFHEIQDGMKQDATVQNVKDVFT